MRLLRTIALLLLCSATQAQDIHFSQFFNSPMDLNPANAGLFDGDYRFNGIYRSQWSSVTVPFSTISLSADAAAPIAKLKNLGLGVSLFNDRAGDSRLNTFQFNIAASYGFVLDESIGRKVTVGLQSGVTSRKIDPNRLSYDEQYNGLYYDPSLGNGENFGNTANVYPNLNFGVMYDQDLNERDHVQGGFSLFNLNRPDQSFYDGPSVPLDIRWNLHFMGEFQVAEKWDILPSFQFMDQHKFQELVIGGAGRYILLDDNGLYRAFSIGGYYRASDAGYIYAGLNYDDWKFGISYDLNFSELTPASRVRGAIELSVQYILKRPELEDVRHRSCPTFL